MSRRARSPSAAPPEDAARPPTARASWLPFQQQQWAFANHIRDPRRYPRPAGIEERRMAIYRELFYNNIESFLSGAFPVLRSLYPARRWHALVRDFFARHRCHTPLFHELPLEFIAYLRHTRRPRRSDPPFLLELAHYEWVEAALDFAPEDCSVRAIEPQGDLLQDQPVVSPLAWRLDYRWPVHRIGPDYRPSEPPPEMTHLVVYRDLKDRVRFLQLSAVSARLLDVLKAGGLSGLQALQRIAAELNSSDPQALIRAGTAALHELRRLGIVLGTRSAGCALC